MDKLRPIRPNNSIKNIKEHIEVGLAEGDLEKVDGLLMQFKMIIESLKGDYYRYYTSLETQTYLNQVHTDIMEDG